LNTASYGLPPRPAWDALQEALTQWRHGSTSWPPWDASTGRARRAFARLVHADPDAIAVGSTVSGMLSVVAAGLPTGSRVLVPEIEFTSNLFPWLVQAGPATCRFRKWLSPDAVPECEVPGRRRP
jgi:selenocysteine lyase/cysteine desulfurase